jgi:hypothetical protein
VLRLSVLRLPAALAAQPARRALAALRHRDPERHEQRHHHEHEQPLPQQPWIGRP